MRIQVVSSGPLQRASAIVVSTGGVTGDDASVSGTITTSLGDVSGMIASAKISGMAA